MVKIVCFYPISNKEPNDGIIMRPKAFKSLLELRAQYQKFVENNGYEPDYFAFSKGQHNIYLTLQSRWARNCKHV